MAFLAPSMLKGTEAPTWLNIVTIITHLLLVVKYLFHFPHRLCLIGGNHLFVLFEQPKQFSVVLFGDYVPLWYPFSYTQGRVSRFYNKQRHLVVPLCDVNDLQPERQPLGWQYGLLVLGSISHANHIELQ